MAGFLVTSLQKRAASALILGPLALAIVYYGGLPFLFLLLALALICLYEWVHVSLQAPRRVTSIVFGVLYILISFWCCYLIRSAHPFALSLLFMSMIWASDIGAYLVGKTVRGPKMASKISPNKTWSGFAGALLSPAILSVVLLNGYFLFFEGGHLPDLSLDLFIFAAGFVVGFVGQAGDLMVSFLKRSANVKDTGRIIPGHGGLLDRMDSMLLAAPVFLFIISMLANV